MEQSLAKSEGHRVKGGSIPGQLVQRPRKKMEQVPSGNEEMPREWKAGDETRHRSWASSSMAFGHIVGLS